MIGKRRETDYSEVSRGRHSEKMLKRKLSSALGTNTPDADPESYISARRKLKKAVLEHYRCVFSGIFSLN